MKTSRWITVVVIVAAFACFANQASAQTAEQKKRKGIEFFERKIRPVLVKHCYRCHSKDAKRLRAELYVDSREGMLKGGESGPALVPGDPNNSFLLRTLMHKGDVRMPPSEKLPAPVIADFRQWIQMGAPDPRGGKTKVVAEKKWENKDLWSLKPIQDHQPPEVKNEAWPKSEIDHFILTKQEQAGVTPVKDADPSALLRRVYFDLIGMQPPPDVVDSFLKDPSPRAFANIVDELLASKHFGERWGRHWLDVARYGESNGKERDVLFPNAWRYRDYVIDAFNADMPFDQFVKEQLAGDLLPAKNPDDAQRQLIATGFLAIGPKSFMARGKRFQMDLVDDQIDVTSRAFLGLTASCARCHDHKFDPIPTKDYYSLASIFYSTKTFYTDRQNGTKTLFVLDKDPKEAARRAKYKQQTEVLGKQIKQSQNRIKRFQKQKKQAKQLAESRKELKELQAKLQKLRKNAPPPPDYAMVVKEGKVTDLKVHVRGELNLFGADAPRGFLTSVEIDDPIEVPPKQSGRLELAAWITDPSNPLTPRVAVNRIWHHLFGRGIVPSVDNFGVQGDEPSHPELLDHLAKRFVDQGWSVKKLIRDIVLSRTYQLAAVYDEKNYKQDPENRLLWRRTLRRLDVEAIRDAMLTASGKLNPQPLEKSLVAQIGYGEVGRGINTRVLAKEFNHRSVYLPIIRGLVPEMLKVFDFAEPSLVVGNRTMTTVPAQALFMMNSELVINNAKSMARQILDVSDLDDEGRVTLAYKLSLSRLPTESETQRALTYLRKTGELLRDKQKNADARLELAWTTYCQALFATAEFRYLN